MPPSRAAMLFGVLAATLGVVGAGCAGASGAADRLPEGVGPLPDERPGTDYVRRALVEYDLFYGDKARSSLRAAARVDPGHPLARAYLLLIGARDAAESEQALAALRVVEAGPSLRPRERTLVRAAIALATEGPLAARAVLTGSAESEAEALADPELAFWASELAFGAGRHDEANAGYRALLRLKTPPFRGRIYDHASASMLFRGQSAEALEVGRRYAKEFPGEPDALGVFATTLAHRGHHDEALRQAELALSMSESEDTLAGLAKVHALRGELSAAASRYEEAMAAAAAPRRVVRRAAAAMVALVRGDLETARQLTAPCLTGGAEAALRERGPCLFVAGLTDPADGVGVVEQLRVLAAEATVAAPAHGDPGALATLLEAHARFDGGGCVRPVLGPTEGRWSEVDEVPAFAAPASPSDFYAAYHVPFFHTWAACNAAAEAAWRGDPASAAMLLGAASETFPGVGLLPLTLAELIAKVDAPGAGRALEVWERTWGPPRADSALAQRVEAVRAALRGEPAGSAGNVVVSSTGLEPNPEVDLDPEMSAARRELAAAVGGGLYEEADPIRLAEALEALAGLHYTRGEVGEALPMYERSLVIRQNALGPDHPDVAKALNTLAGVHVALGDFARALPLAELSLSTYAQTRDPDHPDVVQALQTVAMLHRARGDGDGGVSLEEPGGLPAQGGWALGQLPGFAGVRGAAPPVSQSSAGGGQAGAAPPRFYERSAALVVGVDRYTAGWPALERAVDDARRMGAALRARGFDVVLLENPTRKELMRQLETELPRRVGDNKEGRFVFYFAGHGQTRTSPSTGDQRGYVVPADGTRDGGGDGWHTYVPMRDITDALKTHFASRHVLLVFDSCFSGLALSRSGGDVAAVQSYLSREGVTVLTAGGQGEPARDGLFTGVLIKGLDGQADSGGRPDGFVTFGELAIYVEREVHAENSGQLPRYGWLRGEGQMVFAVPAGP